MKFYIRHLKNSVKKHVEMINKFNNVSRSRLSSHQSVVFLQSNNKHTEKGVIDTSTLNNIKNYLEINIIKEVKP